VHGILFKGDMFHASAFCVFTNIDMFI